MVSIKDYLREIGEFDAGHVDQYRRKKAQRLPGDTYAGRTHSGRSEAEFTSKGKADMHNRYSNPRYGDNALKDMSNKLSESEDSMLMRLQRYLNDNGISNDQIKAVVKLTPVGYQKVAGVLGINATDVQILLNTLAEKLSTEERRVEDDYMTFMNENKQDANARFSYEKDALGSVTVRDAVSGKETYLQGSQASLLLSKLTGNQSDDQRILADYEPLMESEAGFDSEIFGDTGTYNMPWKANGGHGTMTILFGFEEGEPSLKLISVRDEEGDEFEPDHRLERELLRQARDFIGNE